MVRTVNALKVRRARFFGMVDELRSKGKKRKPSVVERDVADAVRAVRASPRRRAV